MIPGIVLLSIGSAGIIAAVVMEHRSHEPKWKILMKIMPWVFGVGAVLFALAIRG